MEGSSRNRSAVAGLTHFSCGSGLGDVSRGGDTCEFRRTVWKLGWGVSSQGTDNRSNALAFQPCQFDYAVFCPNMTEVSSTDNADQQNFTVTLDQVLLRCLTHQQHWSRLAEEQACPAPWTPPSPEPEGPASLLLAPHRAHTHSTGSLVFSCISHALQWISQGRDPVFQPPGPPQDFLAHPVIGSGARVLREAAATHVLVTGSLHLVGGVLKLLEPSLSQ